MDNVAIPAVSSRKVELVKLLPPEVAALLERGEVRKGVGGEGEGGASGVVEKKEGGVGMMGDGGAKVR